MTLSNRIEQAAEGSRELDGKIWHEVIGKKLDRLKFNPKKIPAFTTSLDAAMSLGDGLSEAELWFIWNKALSVCIGKNLDLRHDVARLWAAAALKARGL